jgi:hypothetical protein
LEQLLFLAFFSVLYSEFHLLNWQKYFKGHPHLSRSPLKGHPHHIILFCYSSLGFKLLFSTTERKMTLV